VREVQGIVGAFYRAEEVGEAVGDVGGRPPLLPSSGARERRVAVEGRWWGGMSGRWRTRAV
jgi:hypothetical protein